jgi:hypothetical protein|tara:strand:+ start:595 stop:786 length:192 start_codon:yes stop_codon:yes gene_type:complete
MFEKTNTMETNSVTFKKKWFDRAIPLRFKINLWLLEKLGLFGFALFAFLWGVIATLIIQYVLK